MSAFLRLTLTLPAVLALLVTAAGEAPAQTEQIAQLTARPLVAPADAPVLMKDVFYSNGSSDAPFPNGNEVFGDRAALIPLWEIRAALNRHEVKAPVLVGSRLSYLPPGYPEGERLLLRSVLKTLAAEGENRLELEVLRIPAGVASYLEKSLEEAAGLEQTVAKGVRDPDSDAGMTGAGIRESAAENLPVRAEPAVAWKEAGGNSAATAGNSASASLRRFIIRAENRILGICTIRVFPYRVVAIAPRSLKKGEVVEAGDFPRRSVPAAEIEGFAGSGSDGFYPPRGRYRVIADAEKGSRLSSRQLSPEPAVKAAEQVRVSMRSGAIELRVSGRALASGEVGETIDVRLATGGRVAARITGPGKLETVR